MSRAKKAVFHAIVLTASQIIGMLAGIVTLIVYARVMQKSELAVMPVFQMLAMLCCKLFGLGLDLDMQRKMPGMLEAQNQDARELSRSYSAIMQVGTVLFCLGIFIGSKPLAKMLLGGSDRSLEIVLLIPAIAVYSLFTIMEQILKGIGDFSRLSLYTVIMPFLNLPSTVLGYLFYGVYGLIVGLALPRILLCVFLAPSLFTYMIGRFSPRKTVRFLTDSFPYLVENYMGYAVSYADQWIISWFMSPEILAMYYIPKTIISRISSLMESINNITIANMSRIGSYGVQSAKEAFLKTRRVSIYAFTPLFLLLIAFSYYIIDLSAGKEYLEMAIPFALLGIASMITMIYAPHRVSVMTLCKPIHRLYSAASQGLVLLICLLILVKPFGIPGIAGSYIIGRVAVVSASTYFLKKLFSFTADYEAYQKLLLPSIMMISICLLGQWFYYNYWIVPGYAVVGFMAYLMLFLQSLSPADVRLFQTILPAKALKLLGLFSKRLNEPVA